MQKLNLPYINRSSARAYTFYQIPQIVVDNEYFKGLDGWAIILYGIMLNRASLSSENYKDFTDEEGNLYIIFTVEEVMKRCNCSSKSAVKYLKQLEDIGLIERKRLGLGKPSITYIKDFAAVEQGKFLTCKKYNSGTVENTTVDFSFVQSSNNDINNNDIRNIEEEERNANPLEIGENSTLEKEDPVTLQEADLQPEVIDTYTENINTKIGQAVKLKLVELQVKYGIALLLKAITVSGSKGGMSVSYVDAILKDWCYKGVRTPEEADKLLAKWNETNTKARNNREKAIEYRAKTPPEQKNNGNFKNNIPQMRNYEERQYDDDFFKSLISMEKK